MTITIILTDEGDGMVIRHDVDNLSPPYTQAQLAFMVMMKAAKESCTKFTPLQQDDEQREKKEEKNNMVKLHPAFPVPNWLQGKLLADEIIDPKN